MGLIPDPNASFDEKRNWILGYVSDDDWQSRSGADILEDLRGVGFSIQDSRFYDVRREALGIQRYSEQINRLKEDTHIPERWQTRTIYDEQKRNFLYQVELEGFDTQIADEDRTEDNLSKRYLSIASDVSLTPGEIQDKMNELVNAVDRQYDFEATSAIITRVLSKQRQ